MPGIELPPSQARTIADIQRLLERLAPKVGQHRYKRAGAFSAAYTGQDTYPNLSGVERQIIAVHYHLDVAASTTATVLDLKLSTDGGSTWTTMYTTSANRPTLATGVKEGDAALPDVTAWPAGGLLRVDGITGDAAASGPALTIAYL